MDRNLPDVLRTLSAELKDLSHRTAALQSQLPAQSWSDEAIGALQTLDYLTQALACLAPFVGSLAHATPRTARVRLDSALDLVWMSALADRLSGRVQTGADAEPGACDLFEPAP